MNKYDVDLYFTEEILPFIRKEEAKYRIGQISKDKPLRWEAYNAMLDSLHSNGQITDKQAATYSIPKRLI